jgi:dolichol-phosphate mannosyltransferase
MSSRPDVSVVIPVYCEQESIGLVLQSLSGELSRAGLLAEVLVVDDSPDDATRDAIAVVAPECASLNVTVRHLHRHDPSRPGLAGALLDGMEESHAELTAVMDGDGQHPPRTVVQLLSKAKTDADLAVGARYVDGGSAIGLSNPFRRFVSSSATFLTTTALGPRVRRSHDPMSGCFAYRTSSLSLDRLHPQGFKLLLEILATHDLRVVDVPMTLEARAGGDSKLTSGVLVDGLQQTARLLLGRMRRRPVALSA